MSISKIDVSRGLQNFDDMYKSRIVSHFRDNRGVSNPHQIPGIEKIIVHARVSHLRITSISNDGKQKKEIDQLSDNVGRITGQLPIICLAKKSVAEFKLREGMAVGVKVTLRKKNMYNFFQKLVIMALPRSRKFEGLKAKSLDKGLNLNMTINDSNVFHENEFALKHSLQVTIVTKNAQSREDALELFSQFSLPIN